MAQRAALLAAVLAQLCGAGDAFFSGAGPVLGRTGPLAAGGGARGACHNAVRVPALFAAHASIKAHARDGTAPDRPSRARTHSRGCSWVAATLRADAAAAMSLGLCGSSASR
jgi:hypothetical protein